MAGNAFQQATEGQQNWAIRSGAEPFDLHAFGKGNAWDRFVENTLGITAGIASFGNTDYWEFGKIDDEGEFHVHKRIHAMGLSENWEMDDPFNARLVIFVVDGKYTPFVADTPEGEKYEGDLIQRDDPHALMPNELQHARDEIRNGVDIFTKENDATNDYTNIYLVGTEREIMGLYSVGIDAGLELNGQAPDDMKFKIFTYNSNTAYSELEEKFHEAAPALGIDPSRFGQHNPIGIDFGRNQDMDTRQANPRTWESLPNLREHIDQQEQAAASQLDTMRNEGTFTPLNTPIPDSTGSAP